MISTTMPRSLHTQKLEVRALRRLARPYSGRRHEAGFLSGRNGTAQAAIFARLRIDWKRPSSGMMHSLTIKEVRAFLELIGPASIYGLKAIRFRQESAIRENGIVLA